LEKIYNPHREVKRKVGGEGQCRKKWRKSALQITEINVEKKGYHCRARVAKEEERIGGCHEERPELC